MKFSVWALGATLLFAGTALPNFAPVAAQEQGDPPAEDQQPPATRLPQEQLPITLKAGDNAPSFEGVLWWADKKLEKLEKNRVYLVNFWATWDQPSLESFARIAQLKKKYASEGIEAVAISLDDDDETAAQFLVEQGGKFNFFVGLDGTRKSWRAWGRAAGRSSIPTTFLVSAQGKILWVGDPSEVEPQILPALSEIPLDALPLPEK